MKKYFPILLPVIYLFLATTLPSDVMCTEPAVMQSAPGEKKAQVIYYSRTGNTRIVAETISDTFGHTIQEIEDMKDRSGIFGFIGGMIDVRKNRTTTIKPATVNLEDYDLLFIGSPLWGMKCAPAITTFLHSGDFTNKKVVLFVTTSSRIKQTVFDEYSELIGTKGGIVIDTFFIKTLWKDGCEIEKAAQAILTERAGDWGEKQEGASLRK